jgi:hypothetical protein
MILGNRRVATPTNVFTLIEQDNTYSYAWSTSPLRGSRFRLPLLGIPILNYSGESSVKRTLGVHFFSLSPPQQSGANPPDDEFPFLIIPRSQEMAIDNVWSKHALSEWHNSGARIFAARCCE